MILVGLLGRPAGLVSALTALALGHRFSAIVTREPERFSAVFSGPWEVPIFASVTQGGLVHALDEADLLWSVHGREIVAPHLLARTKCGGGVNLHPCLAEYPGARPIARLLVDGRTRASVGAHWMTTEVDRGPVLAEQTVDVKGLTTPEQVYMRLYPLYATVTRQVLTERRWWARHTL